MSAAHDIWAVVPVKRTTGSKQRLSGVLNPTLRQRLAIAMATDVLIALSAVRDLAGIAVVTVDPEVTELARRFGARIITDGAIEGHTGAVLAAARLLSSEHRGGMLSVPGDIPLVTPAEIETLLASHGTAPCFGIVPAHDRRGSNAVLLSPPLAVPLRFGDDSFQPHVASVTALGIPIHCHDLPGIALDIDTPADLTAFLRVNAETHARTLLNSVLADIPSQASVR
jgi:2-phospho-L-lactate guanylyltransferase